MNENKLSLFGASMLWFGAAVSIAEIFTGAGLAPLGWRKGIAAILIGHFIGCVLFYFVGLIGARSNTGAMESVGIAFGRYGSVFFSVLNVLQLVGWTAVMIIMGAGAMGQIVGSSQTWIWSLLIGALVVIWVAAGLKNVSKLNVVAVGALLVLSIVLAFVVFRGGAPAVSGETMSFALALELSIAMPISWLPLVSDYIKNVKKPFKFNLVSTVSYFAGSSLMYIIGLGAALFSGTSDVAQILVSAGLGVAAMLIVVLSTVTTTFLDVYSAGESFVNIFKRFRTNTMGAVVCVIGTLIAVFVPITQYENFLLLIGSVFVPMASIMVADYFINKHTGLQGSLNVTNAVLWAVGFAVYRIFLYIDPVFGSTIPAVVITMLLSVITNILKRKVDNHA